MEEQKENKEGLGFKKEPKIRANLKMTSKRKDQLKYQTSYILKARRQTKTFCFILGKGPRIPKKQNSLGSKIRSILRVFLLQNIAVPEKFSPGKKRDTQVVSKKTDFSFFFFLLFKPKEPFILILHLPMTKAGQKKERDCLLLTNLTKKNEKKKWSANA